MKSTIIILAGFYLYVLLSLCRCQGRYENVAVNKPCNMSSQQYPQPNCSGAVNNNTDGVYTAGGDNCIQTSSSSNTSWWEVDLGRPYPVCDIHLWAREGYQDRMVGVTVTLDGSLFFQFNSTNTPRGRNITLTCLSPNSPPWASVIRLSKIATAKQVRERNHTINVCEVQVISCSDAYWGSQCNKTCGYCGNNQVCDKETGHCDTCSPGWKLPSCDTECNNGFWGSNCGMTCGHCGQGEVCNKVTGHCRTCLPGWEMTLCSVCADGNYGTDCGSDCGECSEGAACDKATGHCTSCSPGKKLPLCTEACSDGDWGSDCSRTCGVCGNNQVCDKVSGHCDTCSPGWAPPLCADCSDGYWGRNCSVTCGYCGDGEVCDKMTGHCLTCRPGTGPPLCVTACDDGWWGVNCEGRCGNCSDSQVCDKVTGHCSRCSPGFVLPFCRSETAEPTAATGSGPIVGAVVGVVLVVIIVVVVVVLIVRRRRNKAQESADHQINGVNVGQTPGGAVYQNVHDTLNGHVSHNATGAANNGNVGQVYVNVTVNDNPRDPTLGVEQASQPASQPRALSVSAPPLPSMEEGEVEEVEDNEVVVEGDQSYDVTVRERVYYNDEVYMTSEGATLQLDDVQMLLLAKLRGDDMDTEFKALPVGLLKACEAGLRKENHDKNRFSAILPYDDTRVVLRGPFTQGCNDYINANYIRGHQSSKDYIATQGPKRSTTGDFWTMVWQNNVSHIVMLTNLKEEGKRKCEKYWPDPGQHYRYGQVDVTGKEQRTKADYVIRTFQIQLGKDKVREVTQYHYTTWPDHGVPKSTGLVDFWRTVNTAHRALGQPSPLLVHCSAGIGRTGTFIALDIVKNQLRHQLPVDVFRAVRDMRHQRGYMIQTKSQYCILHETILESYTTRDCRLQLEAFDFVFKHPVDRYSKHERTETEFRELKQMKVLMQKPSYTEAEKQENINKNRFVDILPDDSQLVPLTFPVAGRNDYVNAVCMPSFAEQRASLLTQLPLPDTVVDIWRLVAGSDVGTIVSLGSDKNESETKNCYWPRKEGGHVTFGPFTVSLTSSMSLGRHVQRYCLTLKCQGTKVRPVELFHYSDWNGELPGNVEDLVQLVDILLSSWQPKGNAGGPVLLQCSNGATKSGLFHAISDVIGRMMSERVVDVYMAVRKMHIVRPQCVATQVQYRYIYLAVQEYKKKSEIYNNL